MPPRISTGAASYARVLTPLPRLPHRPRLTATRLPACHLTRPSFSSHAVSSSAKAPDDYELPPNWREIVQEAQSKIDFPALEKYLRDERAADRLPGIESELTDPDLRPDAPWGCVVYRTRYDDEAAWLRMCAYLETQVRESLEGRGVMWEAMTARHRFVFVEDRALLEGASPAKVRGLFEARADEELERNWAAQPVTGEMRGEMKRVSTHCGTQYNVCMLVDDVCLQSLDEEWPGLSPVVMLVRKAWDPSIVREEGDEVHPEYEEGWMVDHDEGPNGWIYVAALEYVDLYSALQDPYEWEEDHRFMYPSYVYGSLGMGLERSPGFWKKGLEIAGKKAGEHSDTQS
ncbi:hypothetical protein ACHAQA_007972 [Verticillium albo-atrum]